MHKCIGEWRYINDKVLGERNLQRPGFIGYRDIIPNIVLKLHKQTKMKKGLFLVILIAALVGCNQEKIEQLTSENMALDTGKREADSLMAVALDYFNRIHTDLQAIKQKEGIITLTSEENIEFEQSQEEQILDDILAINDLMDANKKRIQDLESKLKGLQNKLNKKGTEYNMALKQIEELQNLIVNYQGMIAEREAEIVDLKQKLVKKDIEIEELNKVSAEKTATIEKKTGELNTAFYVFGTKKELKDKNVITKEGGILGVGASKKVMDDFNKEYFTQVDITKTSEIPLFAKKVEILSTHPSDSYSISGLDEGAAKITIKNAEKFWSASKYLVVVVD